MKKTAIKYPACELNTTSILLIIKLELISNSHTAITANSFDDFIVLKCGI